MTYAHCDMSPRSASSQVNFGPQTRKDMWVWTNLNGLLRETIFRPLGACCPIKFLHTLQIDQGVCSRTCGAGRRQVGLCPIFL